MFYLFSLKWFDGREAVRVLECKTTRDLKRAVKSFRLDDKADLIHMFALKKVYL